MKILTPAFACALLLALPAIVATQTQATAGAP